MLSKNRLQPLGPKTGGVFSMWIATKYSEPLRVLLLVAIGGVEWLWNCCAVVTYPVSIVEPSVAQGDSSALNLLRYLLNRYNPCDNTPTATTGYSCNDMWSITIHYGRVPQGGVRKQKKGLPTLEYYCLKCLILCENTRILWDKHGKHVNSVYAWSMETKNLQTFPFSKPWFFYLR